MLITFKKRMKLLKVVMKCLELLSTMMKTGESDLSMLSDNSACSTAGRKRGAAEEHPAWVHFLECDGDKAQCKINNC